MTLRDRLGAALKEAIKARATLETSTLRLINAAIHDREISLRGEGAADVLAEADIMAILGKMVKQRQESARIYEEGGRLELAEKERAEIAVIEGFLPRQMNDAETLAAIDAAIAAVGAGSIRDMGRVMAELKVRHMGQMDFGAVGPKVRDRLA